MTMSLTAIVIACATAASPLDRVPTPARALVAGIEPAVISASETWLVEATGHRTAPTVERKGPEHYWGWTKAHTVVTGVSLLMVALGLNQPIKRLKRKDGDIMRTKGSDWLVSGVHLVLAGWFGWKAYDNYSTYQDLRAGHGTHDAGHRGGHGGGHADEHGSASPAAAAPANPGSIRDRADAAHDDLNREEHRQDDGHEHGPKPQPVPDGMVVVEGGVFDATTGSPIRGAKVTVSTAPRRPIKVDPETGMFRSPPIPATRTVVTVTVKARGYVLQEREFAAHRVGSTVQMAFKLRRRH